MKKSPIIVLLFLIFAFISCSDKEVLKETSSLSVVAEHNSIGAESNGISTRSITPVTPVPAKYSAKLIQSEGGNTYSVESENSSFTFEDVKVGTYSLQIEAKDSQGSNILFGKTVVTIKPGKNEPVTVLLSYLESGTGVMSLVIDWHDLTEGNQVWEAIAKFGQLGFRAANASTGEPLSDDGIRWASSEELSAGELEYTADNLAATDGTAIYFEIFTMVDGSEQKIAETFHTTVQIYPSLTSIPDSSESDNFHLNSDTIISYIWNVSKAEAVPGELNPLTSLQVSWENPFYVDQDYYPFHVVLTVMDNETEEETVVESEEYLEGGGNGGILIEELLPKHSYSIGFQVFSNMGFSDYRVLIDDASPKIAVESLSISGIDDTYTVGDEIDVTVDIQPSDAYDKSYKLYLGEDETENPIRLASAGDFVIKAVSNDDPSKFAEKTVSVRLAVPENFIISGVENNGIVLTWEAAEDADGYVISRYRDDSPETEFRINDTSYVDYDVSSGHRYSYSIKAYKNDDGKFDSDTSERTTEVFISNADISVIIPDIESVDFSGILAAALKDKYLDFSSDSDSSLSITLSTEIEGAASYEWTLNHTSIWKGSFDEMGTIVIDKDTEGLNYGNSPVVANSLKLSVTTESGRVFSTTGYFDVYATTIESITDEYGNSQELVVRFGEKLKLKAVLSGDTYEPAIEWESLNPDIVKVNPSTGIVESIMPGEARIRATIKYTGNYMDIAVKSYVPISTISFADLPHTDLIISKTSDGENLPGVNVVDSSYTSINLSDYLSVQGVNGKEIDLSMLGIYSSSIEWTSDNNEAITVNADGIATVAYSPDAEVYVYAKSSDDPSINASVALSALKIDILLNGDIVTGSGGSVASTVFGINDPSTAALSFSGLYDETNFENSEYFNFWCLDGNKDETSGLAFSITSMNFKATLDRKADAYEYYVTALLTDKDTSDTIAIIGFTAKN